MINLIINTAIGTGNRHTCLSKLFRWIKLSRLFTKSVHFFRQILSVCQKKATCDFDNFHIFMCMEAGWDMLIALNLSDWLWYSNSLELTNTDHENAIKLNEEKKRNNNLNLKIYMWKGHSILYTRPDFMIVHNAAATEGILIMILL